MLFSQRVSSASMRRVWADPRRVREGAETPFENAIRHCIPATRATAWRMVVSLRKRGQRTSADGEIGLQQGRERWRERLGVPAMYAVLLTLAAMFFLSYFNRFAGLRSGAGEYTAGVAFLAGRMPYRDYFTTAPPLNVLKSALLLKLFGTALIVSRAAGVGERLLLAALLFRWLRQIARPVPALIASVVTIMVSAGDRTDPIASYNHDAILWAMLSGMAGSMVLEGGRRGWRRMMPALLSGGFAALSVLTKQTVGLGSVCTVLAVVAVLLHRMEGARRAWAWVRAFGCGCLAPLAAAAFTLARLHLLRACLRMLFVVGPAAKAGHASEFLIRELRVGWDNFGWVMVGTVTLAVAWGAVWRSAGRGSGAEAERGQPMFAGGNEMRWAGFILAAGSGMLGLAEVLRRWPALHDVSKSWVYLTLLAVTALLGRYAVGMCAGETMTLRRAQRVLFCAVSWSVAWTLSLSWPAFEAMTLPGLGFVVAAAVEGAGRRALPFVYAVLCFAVLTQAREKLDLPFGFDYQDEAAVWRADAVSVQPQLRGMRLPQATVRFLDGSVATIGSSGREGDAIFTYPEMGLLYALSGRTYPTSSGSHNIDVLNDSFAAEEAQRLRSARPAAIVYYHVAEQQQRDAERLWRNGHPSGQRLLVGAVEDMVKGYRLSGAYRLTAEDPEILVYVRP